MNAEQLMQQISQDWLFFIALLATAFMVALFGWNEKLRRPAVVVLIAASFFIAYMVRQFLPSQYDLALVIAGALGICLTSYTAFWWLPRLAKMLSRGFQSAGTRNFVAAGLLLAWGFRWKIPVDGLAFVAIILAFAGAFYDFERWKQGRQKMKGGVR